MESAELTIVTGFLERVGVDIHKARHKGDYVYCSCPLARWTHERGSDKHPSFYVVHIQPKRLYASCRTCSFEGELATLVWKYEQYSGKLLEPTFRKKLREYRKSDVSTRDFYRDRRTQFEEAVEAGPREIAGIMVPATVGWDIDLAEVATYPEEDLEPYYNALPMFAFRYLLGGQRNLVPEMISEWELGWDPWEERLFIPIRDMKQRLVGYSLKTTNPEVKPSYKNLTNFKKRFYLYGEHKMDLSVRRAILVEGYFDVIYLYQCGYRNIFALMGKTISKIQVQKLVQNFEHVDIALDGDKAGIEAAPDVERELKYEVSTKIVMLPKGKDPDQLLTRYQRNVFFGDPTHDCLTIDLGVSNTILFERFNSSNMSRPGYRVDVESEVDVSSPTRGLQNRPPQKPRNFGGGGDYKPGGFPLWIWGRDPFRFKVPVYKEDKKDDLPSELENHVMREFVPVDREFYGVKVHEGQFLIQLFNGEVLQRFGVLPCSEDLYETKPCCEMAEKKDPSIKFAQWRGHSTVIPSQHRVDGKGNIIEFEPVLFAASSDACDIITLKLKENGDKFENHRWKAFRNSTTTTPQVGSAFMMGKPVDPARLFKAMTWAGFKLSELYDVAEKFHQHMEGLKRLFQVKVDEHGRLLRVPPAFNYEEVLRPLNPKKQLQTLGKEPFDTPKAEAASNRPAAPQGNMDEFDVDPNAPAVTDAPAGSSGDDDDIPF